MKLHDLRPAPGSHKKKTRVGRGIAAGKGKTAGRGTKGQKARAGGGIPARFEGGQTPLHIRIPKLRGFKNPFKIDYEVVNVGAITHLVELGVLESGEMPGTKKAKGAADAPITVNQEILRAAGLVRSLRKPLKILGHGELSTALFVVADAVSGSARAKIEAAGGTVSLLEVPTGPLAALGVAPEAESHDDDAPAALQAAGPADAGEAAEAVAGPKRRAKAAPRAAATEAAADAESLADAEPVPSADAPADEAKAAEGPDTDSIADA
ncbi:MAG: 50S ribosomal protein L15 [Chloroflexi bacterium]|nr:50S ribosomal protein L15 [Chloroflexota bacterium]